MKQLLKHLRQLLRRTSGVSYPARLLWATAAAAVALLFAGLVAPSTAPYAFFLFLFLPFLLALAVSAILFDRLTGVYVLALSSIALYGLFGASRPGPEMDMNAVAAFVGFALSAVVVLVAGDLFRLMARAIDKGEEAKAMVLDETQHRIRNVLQVVNAILIMEEGRIQEEGGSREEDEPRQEDAKASLERISRRVSNVAHIIRALEHADQAGLFDARHYFEELVREIGSSLAERGKIGVNCRVDGFRIDRASAELLGIMVNELIANAVEHAFPGQRKGSVMVYLDLDPGGMLRLSVADDGVGCGLTAAKGTGLKLVSALAKLHDGDIHVEDGRPGCKVTAFIQPQWPKGTQPQ